MAEDSTRFAKEEHLTAALQTSYRTVLMQHPMYLICTPFGICP